MAGDTDHQVLIHWTPKATVPGSVSTRIMNHDQPTPSPAIFQVPPVGHSETPAASDQDQQQSSTSELPPTPTFSHTLTLKSTYRSSSTTLAATAFFGASLSYAAVFSYLSTSPAILSWAASLFLVGAVAAGGMSVMSSVDTAWPGELTSMGRQTLAQDSLMKRQSDPEKGVEQVGLRRNQLIVADPPQRNSPRVWVVRVYGYLSVLLVLTGLICLNVTVIMGALQENARGEGSSRSDGVAQYWPTAVVAAGVFGIAGSLALTVGAVLIRERYFDDYGRQHFLIESVATKHGMGS